MRFLHINPLKNLWRNLIGWDYQQSNTQDGEVIVRVKPSHWHKWGKWSTTE